MQARRSWRGSRGFALDGGRVDSFWAFTFTYATAAADAVLWIAYTKPAGATGYAEAIVTLMTVFIAAIAGRTIIALARASSCLLHPRIP